MVAKKIRDSWTELLFHMAKGSQVEYDKIKQMDVFEFYTLRDLYEAELRAKNAATRQKQNNKKN